MLYYSTPPKLLELIKRTTCHSDILRIQKEEEVRDSGNGVCKSYEHFPVYKLTYMYIHCSIAL